MDDHSVHTIPNHHPINMDVLLKTCLFKSSLLYMVSAAFKYIPQTTATTFAFSFLLWGYQYWCVGEAFNTEANKQRRRRRGPNN